MSNLPISHSYLLILLGLAVLEIAAGKFFRDGPNANEAAIEIGSVLIALLGRPLVYVLVFLAATAIAPESRDLFADWPFWVWIPVFLIGEDMAQYWWHRLGHTAFGWRWHRTHHAAPYMGVRVALRNSFLYQFLMPSAWTAVLFIYLGAGVFAPIYGVVKGLVAIGSHSELRWDRFLYKNKALSPLA